MKPCEIAVIVPVHNAAAFLTACTDAIAAQKFDGFRCILVEDGSTDDSPALCDAIAAGDQRFVALHHELLRDTPRLAADAIQKVLGA